MSVSDRASGHPRAAHQFLQVRSDTPHQTVGGIPHRDMPSDSRAHLARRFSDCRGRLPLSECHRSGSTRLGSDLAHCRPGCDDLAESQFPSRFAWVRSSISWVRPSRVRPGVRGLLASSCAVALKSSCPCCLRSLRTRPSNVRGDAAWANPGDLHRARTGDLSRAVSCKLVPLTVLSRRSHA